MILQELSRYYQRVAESGSGTIAPEGWVNRPVDYFIVLAPGGNCVSIEDNGRLEGRRRIARNELVPAIGKQALKHTNSGKDPNLLWDNAAFVLGLGNKGTLKADYFIAEIDKWFAALNDPALTDLKVFLQAIRRNGETKLLLDRFDLTDEFEQRDPILAFRWQPDGPIPIHHRPLVRETYEHKRSSSDTEVKGNCLITGAIGVPIAQNETVIKGVWNSQTSGANIISFNSRSFESYGKREKGGENAPISKQSSFAYTTALNHLLRKGSNQRMQVGNASTVFWSEKPSALEDSFASIFDEPPKDDPARQTRAIEALFKSPQTGSFVDEGGDTPFYVLGLAPNAARISVRFWLTGTVAGMSQRIRQYFEDLKIVHASFEKPHLSLFRLLVSTATLGKSENIPPNLAGDVMRAILEGLPYPQTLLAAAVRRIRAEREVTYPRASLIKACLNRQGRYSHSQEKELNVSLDETNLNPGYRTGRLFAVLEKIQEESSPGLNATIRDRFYGAAASTPVTVFANLMKLKNHHLAKLEEGRKRYFEKLIGEILSSVSDFPAHLNLADQGRFAIGYYHQRQAFFIKSESVNKGE
ncbi:type I-C CRISPR-associated protein Cas8c/Csd1 [Nitrosomonas sp. HPC101]|uniref:type I-C CRISPR-associated protein Cas8c/Csd1 n=1 Tax=Nitrosomonas sp. HPC101 TaxID=1658667 RepID=UPI001368FAB8|nr:type I-C CRISPR-associated protein Cas8c/Csd1 [Nitrosomonas sp. HPC101]MXS85810.1 type I-C CRISPR-associated protein Cas8c/Csd1 [Nitrosomonas sp. HPC101]